MANNKPKSPKGNRKQKKRGTPITDLPPKNLQPDATRHVKGGVIRPMYGSPATRDT